MGFWRVQAAQAYIGLFISLLTGALTMPSDAVSTENDLDFLYKQFALFESVEIITKLYLLANNPIYDVAACGHCHCRFLGALSPCCQPCNPPL